MKNTGWSCNTEGLIFLHDDIETAVREHVCDIPDIKPDTMIKVIRWEPVVITRKDCGSPLEDYLLERLNDEFLPDEIDPEITPAMKAAEDAFIAAVLAEYKPRALTQVEEVVVRVGDYYQGESE